MKKGEKIGRKKGKKSAAKKQKKSAKANHVTYRKENGKPGSVLFGAGNVGQA